MTDTGLIATRMLGIDLGIAAPPTLAARLRDELRELLDARPSVASTMLRLDLTALQSVHDALAEITRFVVMRSPLLCVHAGVVAAPRGLVAIPGTSGHGKTTLVAALVRAGLGYVSDEVLAIDRTSGQVTAFPRPLALDRTSWAVLGLDPADAPDPERLVAPSQLGALGQATRVTDIVLTARGAKGTSMVPGDPGAAVAALLGHAFNHFANGPTSFTTAVSVARAARSWRAEYADAPDLAALLIDRISGAEPGRAHHPTRHR